MESTWSRRVLTHFVLQSITFDEFKAFCLFTNNLEDFAFSVKLVADAHRPIGMGNVSVHLDPAGPFTGNLTFALCSYSAQFKRAVKIATGHDLSDNVLDTIFKLFDMDGDNRLSHKEFIGVMKDRVLRGLKVGFHYDRCVSVAPPLTTTDTATG